MPDTQCHSSERCNSQPRVITVVIPSYNCAEFLPQAIDSVLAQSRPASEILIIDDGSTDDTFQIVNSRYRNSAVRYIRQENRGLPGARNRGVREARGEFVAALDADDALAPTALEEMAGILELTNASWCLIDILKFWENYREVQKTHLPEGDLWLGILREDFIRRAMLFRRKELLSIGIWDEAMRMREDWDLNIRLIKAKKKFAYLNRPLYHYRRRPGSITTGDPSKLFEYTERLLRKHHKSAADAGDARAAPIYAANMWDLARNHYYLRKDVTKALLCSYESMLYDFDLRRLSHPVLHHFAQRLNGARQPVSPV